MVRLVENIITLAWGLAWQLIYQNCKNYAVDQVDKFVLLMKFDLHSADKMQLSLRTKFESLAGFSFGWLVLLRFPWKDVKNTIE